MNKPPEGILEVRPVGSERVNGETVQNAIVNMCVPIIKKMMKVINPALQVNRATSAQVSLNDQSDRRVVYVDLENGQRL
jgi:hypothetical protein